MRVKSGSECLDVLWIVLPVGVQSDCPLEAERCGNAESRFQRLPLASIPVMPDDLGGKTLQSGSRAVCAAVVHHDDVAAEVQCPFSDIAHRPGIVVARNDYAAFEPLQGVHGVGGRQVC